MRGYESSRTQFRKRKRRKEKENTKREFLKLLNKKYKERHETTKSKVKHLLSFEVGI